MNIFGKRKKREVLFVLRVPDHVLVADNEEDAKALESYKKLFKNVCDEKDAGIMLPSTQYPPEEGGGLMYEIEVFYLDL